MTIKTKLTEKDFINVNFLLLYQKIWMRIVTIIMSIGLVSALILWLTGATKIAFSELIWPLVFLGVLPLLTYFGTKRNFASNKRISEEIEYRFSENFLELHGESFNSQLTWDKIYKVTQTKNWVLIWHNAQVANPIPKRDIWEGDVAELKNLLIKHGVKTNL